MGNKLKHDSMFKIIDAGSVPPSPAKPPRMDQDFVRGSVATPAGDVPRIDSILHFRDHWGSFKARWDMGRMDYAVDPGLYALGHPDSKSPVLVSANYKMSFDALRSSLPGRDAWILVLDTEGINVWCAAGEGTFGTDEVVRRIEATGLKKIVDHREIIVPQLGGPGVSGYQVKLRSGFRVRFGPIKAEDIPAYLDAGFKATAAMRRKSFDLGERIALIPVELVHAFKPALFIIPVLFLTRRPGRPRGVLGKCLEFRRLCSARLFERCHRRGCPHTGPAALPAGPGIYHEGDCCRRGNCGRRALPEGEQPVRSARTDRGFFMAHDNHRAIRLPRHEFYRLFDIYIPVRGKKRNALGAAAADCDGDLRARGMDHIALYFIGDDE